MPTGKKLNEIQKAQINVLRSNSSLSNRKIAKIINRSEGTVRKYLKNPVGYGQKASPGRPSTVTKLQRRALIRSACNSTKSSRALCEEGSLNITARRARQILNESGRVKAAKMLRKPLLSPKNIQDRLQFSISHMSWDIEWNKVIFSDEKRFNKDGPDRWAYYWHDLRTDPRIFSKRQSGGGSVMVWGAIGFQKKVKLQFINNRMNAVDYQNMIGPLFPAWGYEMAGLGWQLQQDNAPIHVAKSTVRYFEDRNINLFRNWPAKSPDMNIMENIWSILARQVYAGGRQYDQTNELVNAIEKAWKTIDQATIQGLYKGLQRRMMALYDARGKSTRY